MSALLETRGVRKTFGAFTAVDDVNIVIKRDSVHGLIGPNGAGKSTLLGLLCGLHLPDRGDVLLNGRRITQLNGFQRVRLGIGVKFQLTRVLPDLTVDENLRIAYRVKLRGSARLRSSRVDEVLNIVGLRDRRHIVARELSHGERKWLEIGAVLLTNPSVLILDEPTSAMSPHETERCAELIRTLRDSAAVDAILVVEHDTKFIASLCDSITVLHHGRVLSEGTFDELQASPDVRDAYLGGIDV